MCLVEIMSHVNPKLTKYLKQLKCQALKRQKVLLEVLGMGTSSSAVEVVPPMTIMPPSSLRKGVIRARRPSLKRILGRLPHPQYWGSRLHLA